MLAAYLALAYAAVGFCVFVHVLAYNLTGPGAHSLRLSDPGYWTVKAVTIAVIMVLLYCLLVWPYAVVCHRRNVAWQQARARAGWED